MSVIKPIENVEFLTSQLATEGFSLKAVPGALTSLIDSTLATIKGFSASKTELPILDLTKDQKSFLKIVDTINYTQLSQMQAHVPMGYTGLYLDYISVLNNQVNFCKGIQSGILQPYTSTLAQMVSDHKSILRTDTGERRKSDTLKQIDLLNKQTSPFFTRSSLTTAKVQDLIQRNADWNPVITGSTQLKNTLESISQKETKDAVDMSVHYLAIIRDGLKTETDRVFTNEAAAYLGNMTLAVAKALEFYSIAYFRVLEHNGGLHNTIEKFNKAFS